MTETQIRDLVRKYRDLDARMLRYIARAFEESGENAPELASQPSYELQEEMQGLMDEMAAETQEAVRQAYISGYERDKHHDKAYAALLKAAPLLYFAYAINALGRKTLGDTQKFTQQANRGARRSWQRAQMDAVNRAVARYNRGGITWRQAKQSALNELASAGITHFVDKKNRSWELGAYVEMGIRTGINQSARAGFLLSMEQRGKDLVYASSHFGSCPLCAVWQGQVLSINGNHPDYPSLQDAINDGLFHPNCRHVLLEYIEGISDLRNDDSPESRAHYQLTQAQRRYERGVRQWKNREMTAITSADRIKANSYRKQWQSALKDHVEKNGLARRYDREQITTPVAANDGASLSDAEKSAISRYVGGESYVLNAKMREGIPLTEQEQQWLNHIVSGLEKLPNYEGTVYRSITPVFTTEEEILEKYINSNLVIEKQLLSTSKEVYDERMAIQFIIESKSGKGLAGFNDAEIEVLFSPGTPFWVSKIEGATVYLKEVTYGL